MVIIKHQAVKSLRGVVLLAVPEPCCLSGQRWMPFDRLALVRWLLHVLQAIQSCPAFVVLHRYAFG